MGTHYYTPFDLQKTSNRFLIIGALINLVLNSFLIYFLKSIGAAIASVIAEGVITCLYILKDSFVFDSTKKVLNKLKRR